MEKTELDYRLELLKLVSFCSICSKNNTDNYIIKLCERINNVYEFLGEEYREYRFEYDGWYGLVLKK